MKKDVAWLKKFKFSGYIQSQYQHADTVGISTFAGGNFPAQSNNRFTIRRGRLKLNFEHENKKGVKSIETVFQIEFRETGLTIRDAYGIVREPFSNWVGLQFGLFNRPFGYELPYSSKERESPERSRMIQTLFPAERDLGVSILIDPPAYSKYAFFRIKAGFFNGTGNFWSEIDKKKDFIGQLILYKETKDKSFKISGGFSYYKGYVLKSTNNYYSMNKEVSTPYVYIKNTDSTTTNKHYFIREYFGSDIEATYNWKIGYTTFRAEYVSGIQPGQSTSDLTPVALGNDIYLRKVNGAVFNLINGIQDKKHFLTHELVLKYDYFDPNTRVKALEMNSVLDSKISGADVKYQTFGMGYNLKYQDWFKLSIYYEIVKNEITAIKGYERDLKDNVLTIRTQFSFK